MICEPIQKEVKNIIFLIGDGMGVGQTRLFDVMNVSDSEASVYSDGEDIFYGYYFPSQGRARTNSLSGVTDSAAAATALSTGYKTKNKYVGKNSMGKDVQSLTELAAELGKATAVMSTESATGATPAGFSAHVLNRNDSDGITVSQELLKNEYGTQITCGYNVYDAKGVDQIRKEIRKTLEGLSKDNDGFFLMYEEAYIDKHCESNNLSKTFCALVRFNQAIGVFMEYAFYHPDTFVLITADHETGGLALNLSGTYSYSTTQHTDSNVPIFAYGMNSEVFDNRVIENTQIPKTLAHILGKENFGARDQYGSLLAQ
jgi:alkaline phosphatase